MGSGMDSEAIREKFGDAYIAEERRFRMGVDPWLFLKESFRRCQNRK
jgi:hypothetical protein